MRAGYATTARRAYVPKWTRVHATGEMDRDATIMIAAALTTPIARGVFIGAEARYFRKYEGITLDVFSGEALFAGPTLFAKVSEKSFISAAWNSQVAGHAVGEP